jgi:hypothetical protein
LVLLSCCWEWKWKKMKMLLSSALIPPLISSSSVFLPLFLQFYLILFPLFAALVYPSCETNLETISDYCSDCCRSLIFDYCSVLSNVLGFGFMRNWKKRFFKLWKNQNEMKSLVSVCYI